MKRAFISDVHANLEALQAVLQDIHSQQVDEIYCLGDVLGYGPNPRECLDLIVRECKVCLLGACDQLLCEEPEVTKLSLEHIVWMDSELMVGGDEAYQRRYRYFINASSSHDIEEEVRIEFSGNYPITIQLVHGSPLDNLNGYIFPEDVYNNKKMAAVFEAMPLHCFHGHTHIPGIIGENGFGFQFLAAQEIDGWHRIGLAEHAKALVNVGSVGQPRDGDPRACYVIWDHQGDYSAVQFFRVEYPYNLTIEKLKRIPPT